MVRVNATIAFVPAIDRHRALAFYRDILGSSFVAGVALYTATRTYTYDDRLHVMPIDRIWTTT